MAKAPTQKPQGAGQTLSSDAAMLGANIPVIGGLVSAFFKISSRGKAIVLAIVVLLILYPLISLFAAMLIISKSPASVQNGARSFILNALGMDEQMMERVNRSNLVIDASIPFKFSFGENEQATQRVAAGQRITFEALLKKVHVDDDPSCAIQQPEPEEAIGVLSVRSLGSKAEAWTERIDPTFGQLFTVGTLGDADWKRFQQSMRSGGPEQQHLLKIKLTENPALANSPFLKCNKVSVDLYMNIFKPPLVRAST